VTETIVAVFNTPTQAEAAIRDLKTAGVPASNIRHYTKDDAAYQAHYSAGGTQHQGFWSWLLGESDQDNDRTVYDQTVQSGGTVVTVIADEQNAGRVSSTLLAHSPADFDEQASRYGLMASGERKNPSAPAGLGKAQTEGKEEVIPLAEETLDVGKRDVNRTTRLRRYVIERPVEEQVRLRDETVRIERRPVGGATVPPDAFTEKTIEVAGTKEEAVVTKTARVAEEVVVRKDATERVETVRDTVRREQVDVEGEAADRESLSPAGISAPKR